MVGLRRAPVALLAIATATGCTGRSSGLAVVVLPADYEGPVNILYTKAVSGDNDDKYDVDSSNAVIVVRSDGWAVVRDEIVASCKPAYYPRDVVRRADDRLQLAQGIDQHFYGYFADCTAVQSGLVLHGTFSGTLPLTVDYKTSNAEFDAKVTALLAEYAHPAGSGP